jgi:hypothetical protein
MALASVVVDRSCRLDQCAEQAPVPEPPLIHYVVVRADLPRGIQSAAIVHAAGESAAAWLAEQFKADLLEPAYIGLPQETHAVVLTVPDQSALLAVSRRLDMARVRHCPIDEPDAPYSGAWLSLGLFPGAKEVLRRYVSSLPLLR